MNILLIAVFLILPFTQQESQNPQAEEDIKEYVANSFEVSTSDVALVSPDQVYVNQGGSTEIGRATFNDCGNPCTNVVIVFPDITLDFEIIEEITGI